jgi:DNA-directed RNA polymerase specialized sigma24 family protein
MPIVSNASLDQLAEISRDRIGEMHKQLLRRASFLLPEDRLLIDLIVRNRLSRRQVGAIMGKDSGTLTRRLQRLSRRLHDPLAIALTDPRCPLPQAQRQLGIEHFLQGLSTAELADRHRMPPTRVRHILIYLRGWQRGRAHR